MKIKLEKIFLFILCLFIKNLAIPSDDYILKVVSNNSPPYYYLENSQIKGLDVDLTKIILSRMNLKYKFYLLPWNEAVKKTFDGKYDLLLHNNSLQETSDLFFNSNTFYNADVALFKNKDWTAFYNKNGQINRFKIGISSHIGLENIFNFKKNIIYNIYGENSYLIGMLKSYFKEIDFFLCDIKTCEYIIHLNKKKFPELNKINLISTLKIDKIPINASFSRINPSSNKLRNDFNNYLNLLKNTAEYKIILNKYNNGEK